MYLLNGKGRNSNAYLSLSKHKKVEVSKSFPEYVKLFATLHENTVTPKTTIFIGYPIQFIDGYWTTMACTSAINKHIRFLYC